MAIAERRTEYDVRPKSAVKTVWFHGAFVCRRLQGVPDRLRFFLISRTKSRFSEGFQMKIINLRYYYPTLYTHDVACAVSDELKDLLDQFILEDYRYEAKPRHHRAFYSYEALNGIEKDILLFAAPSPCELYEQKNRHTAPYTPLC